MNTALFVLTVTFLAATVFFCVAHHLKKQEIKKRCKQIDLYVRHYGSLSDKDFKNLQTTLMNTIQFTAYKIVKKKRFGGLIELPDNFE